MRKVLVCLLIGMCVANAKVDIKELLNKVINTKIESAKALIERHKAYLEIIEKDKDTDNIKAGIKAGIKAQENKIDMYKNLKETKTEEIIIKKWGYDKVIKQELECINNKDIKECIARDKKLIIERLKEKIDDSEKTIKRWTAENDKLKEAIKKCQATIKEYEKDNKEKNIESCNKGIKAVEKEINHYNTFIRIYETRIKEYEAEIDLLNAYEKVQEKQSLKQSLTFLEALEPRAIRKVYM